MEEAGKQLIPLCLELGGNDAMIVLSDAPLSGLQLALYGPEPPTVANPARR
jgi:acyl-CoA reductase-like NAD-dependent aldehyde dehydrogenase